MQGCSAMVSLFKERRSTLGLDVYIPSETAKAAGAQAEWHAGRLMSRLSDGGVTADELKKARRRLDKVMPACMDVHRLLWPGCPVPLRNAICNSHKAKDATRQQIQASGRT